MTATHGGDVAQTPDRDQRRWSTSRPPTAHESKSEFQLLEQPIIEGDEA